MEWIGKEDEGDGKKVAVPPVKPDLHRAVAYATIPHDARHKALARHTDRSTSKRKHEFAAGLLLACQPPKRARSMPDTTGPSACANSTQRQEWRRVGIEPGARPECVLPAARQNVSTSSPLAFSLLVGHPKGRDRCLTLPVRLYVETARRGSGGGVRACRN